MPLCLHKKLQMLCYAMLVLEQGITVVMPTAGAAGAMEKLKRRMSMASATTDSNSANWSPAKQMSVACL